MPWVYIGTSKLKCAYVWTTAVKCIYVWTTKVRPTWPQVEFLLVGWGWAWGRSRYYSGWGWGGGWVVYCPSYDLDTDTCVVIWAWGVACITQYTASCQSWKPSCFGTIVAYGWGGGWAGCHTWGKNWANWGSGGWGWACPYTAWNCWQWGSPCWSQGKAWAASVWANYWWGWGWYSVAANKCQWGNWLCSDISWEYYRYASWGWGGTDLNSTANAGCGGWAGGKKCFTWCPATTYGSGWGGAGCSNCSSSCTSGGNGYQWIFILRYPTSCDYDIGGGCKYKCWDYTIHCFTENGCLKLYEKITSPWIYHSAEDCLISLSTNGTSRITLMDRNLWATTYDTTDTASYGCYFQRGNNYGFPQSWFTKTSTRVDASCYWPWNYYCSSNFICTSSNCDRSTVTNNNLWGDTTNTVIARQWPSPSWFHVPTFGDKCGMVIAMQCVLWRSVTTQDTVDYLFMPKAWYLGYNSGNAVCVGSVGYRWLSSYTSSWSYNNGLMYQSCCANCSAASQYNRRGTGYSVRPFANTWIQPNTGWCKLS